MVKEIHGQVVCLFLLASTTACMYIADRKVCQGIKKCLIKNDLHTYTSISVTDILFIVFS